MNETFEITNQEKAEESQEEPTCKLCRSPLIQEAIDAGKCQCCGHPIKPKEQQAQAQ